MFSGSVHVRLMKGHNVGRRDIMLLSTSLQVYASSHEDLEMRSVRLPLVVEHARKQCAKFADTSALSSNIYSQLKCSVRDRGNIGPQHILELGLHMQPVLVPPGSLAKLCGQFS